jgi:TPR repeat protein
MDEERSIRLARMSSGSGSKYGQFALGVLSNGALEVQLYQLAAEQGLDSAQAKLGKMHFDAADLAESLRWYRIAAAQGHPDALFGVGVCHFNLFVQNNSVRAHLDTAICYFERAHAAGHSLALGRMGMCKTFLKLPKFM